MASWKKDASGSWKKSTSKSDKNYTIVDGKKVLKSSIKSSGSGSLSDSWAKDTVTLDEAKAQSTQAADYLYQSQQAANASAGIVETVDVGSVGLSDSWNQDTVTLAQAAAQTSQATEYLTAKDTQTAQAQADAIAQAQAQEEQSKSEAMRNGLVGTNTSMYSDITGQYVPSIVNPEKVQQYLAEKEAAKIQAQKRAIAESQTMQLISGFGNKINLQETAEQTRSEKLASLLTGIGSSVKSSSVGQSVSSAMNEVADSDIVKKYVSTEDALLSAIGMPTITQATTEASKVVSSISEAASYGFSGGQKGKIETTDKEYITVGIARKGSEYAEKITEKGSALVSSGIDLLAGKDDVLQVPSFVGTGQTINVPAQTAKDFVTGATVDMGSFLVSGISGVPLATEVAVRDPTKFAGALVAGAGLVIGSTAKMAIDDPAKFAGNIAGGLAMGKVGGDVAGSVKAGKAQIVKQTGSGAKPTYETIDYGAQLSIADNPVLSFSKESGIKVGKGVAAPMELLDANTPITAFDKAQTANFIATLEKHGIEADYFQAGHNIAKSVNRTPTPVKAPTSFEITSENIPASVKPTIKKVLQEYSGDVEVYGSVAQKAQMGEYMNRLPADMEIMVPDQYAMTAKLAREMGKKGDQFKIEGITKTSTANAKPKIAFGDQKGIEIFSSFEDIGSGYHPKSQVAYGLKDYAPIEVDKINIMDLREQGGRKLGGGLTLQKSAKGTASIEPVHAGRLKDVGDLLEIGVGHALEKKPGIAADVLKFNELARKKYGPQMGKSKLSNFMEERGRLPSKTEIGNLIEVEKGSRELLFKKFKEPESLKGSSSLGKIGRASKAGSLAGLGSSAKTGKGKKTSTGKGAGYSSPSIKPTKQPDLKLPSFPSLPKTKPNGNKNSTPAYPGKPKKPVQSIPAIPGYVPPSPPGSIPNYPGGGGGSSLIVPPSPTFPSFTGGDNGKSSLLLPGTSKGKGPKKAKTGKVTPKPGTKKNKYRNPLDIEFKL